MDIRLDAGNTVDPAADNRSSNTGIHSREVGVSALVTEGHNTMLNVSQSGQWAARIT